ncbi:MAG: serine--tRNA ligase [Acidobacteria bacterium]|nr:serine--tRNA ligase [Acidobacteriota bacterium]
MHDLSKLRKDPDGTRAGLSARNVDFDLDDLLGRDQRRRGLIQQVDALKAQRNEAGKKIGKLKKSGGNADDIVAEMGRVSGKIETLDAELNGLDEGIHADLLGLPNLPHETVPAGRDETSNTVERTWGERRDFDFKVLDHVDVGEALRIIDLERAAKVSGARFPTQFGAGAALERGLAAFMLDLAQSEGGYLEVFTPFLVLPESMEASGQLPKFADEAFFIEKDSLYLIPTSEVPLVNLHRGEILDVNDLPIRYCAYTPCFRREAGSYGKDTRGMIRVHQFTKCELVWYTTPEASYEALETLVSDAERVLQRLELPYQVVSLCTGELGFAAAKTYDIEVWLPSQQRYREISSCSNCEDFQARRAEIRYRPREGKKPRLVHTLNGSGLAIGRTIVALLENYQEADGSVTVPEALRPYMNGLERIELLKRPGT